MKYICECEATKDAFVQMLKNQNLVSDLPFCGRVKKMADSGMEASATELERLIGYYISGTVSVSHPDRIFRAVISDGRCYFGEIIWEIDRNPYHERKPGKRPFFHPGVMMPRMIRSLVNISGAMPGERVLDPFCGTGGTLIESELIGCLAIGTDADPLMIKGCRLNHQGALAAVADAGYLPFPDESIDHVVSDLPYGQSVLIIGSNLSDLYLQAFSEIKRIVKPGKRSVIVTHKDIQNMAEKFFSIIIQYEQRVHRSLTRRILVVVK
jgi:tRNA (guanine10-N2)-dimethyltransferase